METIFKRKPPDLIFEKTLPIGFFLPFQDSTSPQKIQDLIVDSQETNGKHEVKPTTFSVSEQKF